MFKNFKKLIYSGLFFLIIISSFCLVQFNSASAGTKEDLDKQLRTAGGTGWGYLASRSDMSIIIQTAVSAFLGLLGIIFLILIIYAGYNWMMARGDEEKITKAKDTLTRAIIGLIIMLAAYSITYFVFNSIPKGEGTGSIPGTTNSGP